MFEYVHHVGYAVEDMDHAVRVFGETFELEPIERRVIEGEKSFEMATFRCGPTIIELLRPIRHPALERFLEDNGPGLNHVAFAVKDLPGRIEELERKGVAVQEPFVAGTGWKIANFDLGRSDLPYFQDPYHSDHLAEADPQ
ncbi:MAG: VOC family protein [Planctomycetota bacterium]|jgi:methylmalonyl-CoA/ethylmalonyl-CoA epimerase